MRDVVPLKPVREAVEAAMALQEWSAEDERLMPLTRMWDADDFKKMFVRTDRETIPFDFADQTLCLLGLQFLWWDELSDIYYSVDLDPQESVRVVPKGCRRCERVGCSEVFPIKGAGHTEKRFCSGACKRATSALRNGVTHTLPVGPGRKLRIVRCRKGHERTPENTRVRPNGTVTCRDCARESTREWHHRPENRERRNAEKRALRAA